MAYDYSELLAQAKQWAQRAQAEGRLAQRQVQLIERLDSGSTESLFSGNPIDAESRPLVVAFMGGTGVGKSSLLNRLAGQPIARAGIERPTSREVTLYHHQGLALQTLPSGLPLDSVKISRHNDAGNSHIVWIDMPDFDSVELGNQRQVLQWLPHIDVLLYVVSPERYRDNKAWQLLLAEGAKHAWVFVMNQWDRGQPVQYEDFKQQLGKAGFDEPLIFRTSCTEPAGDEFTGLLEQLRQLSGRHTIAQLEQRGEHRRLHQLKLALQQCEQDFSGQDYPQLRQYLQSRWPGFELELMQGLDWPILQLAQFWSDNLGQKIELTLWDDWAQGRFNDFLDELVLQAGQCGIPGKPLKSALQSIRASVDKNVAAQCEFCARQALLKPGNGLQRLVVKLAGLCEVLLPLAAMAVVGYQVFVGYYHSAADATAYLGTDFAVHSVLLVALSWLMPFFLHKKLQPSLRKSVCLGLKKGMRLALARISLETGQSLLDEQRRNESLREQLSELIKHCAGDSAPAIAKGNALSRAVVGGLA